MNKVFKITSIVTAILAVIVITTGVTFYLVSTKNVALSEDNLNFKDTSVTVYASDNNAVNRSNYTDAYVELEYIPTYMQDAFVSVEDKRFYKHNGLDYIRIAGAIINNIKVLELAEGASTISQQLIKNTHLTSEKSFRRKLQEAKLAIELEQNYSKDEILEMYLNALYFGNSIYGVSNASERIFNKSVMDLDLGECALLAGIVKNPAMYSPISNYDNSVARKNQVLTKMLNQEMITENDYNNAINLPIVINYTTLKYSDNRAYVVNALIEAARLIDISVESLKSKDYKIYTYLDTDTQINLSKAVLNNNYTAINSYGNVPDCMGMIADNENGGIIAYSSTTPYSVYDIRRQAGSAIKPISVYSSALEAGTVQPATQILDEETTFGDYTPRNYNNSYSGWVSVREALSQSMNVPAVKVLAYMGAESAIEYMDKFGLMTENEEENLALALGGTYNGSTITEMTAAYRALATGGRYDEISFIKKIENADGEVIYEHNVDNEQIISEETAYLLTDMLITTATKGTGSKLASLPYQIATKTGTVSAQDTNYNKDAWNLSYSSEHTMCIWQGNTSNSEEFMLTKGTTGGAYPTMIARDVYREMYKNKYPNDFARPNTIIDVDIDLLSLENEHLEKLSTTYTPDEYKVKEKYNDKYKPTIESEYFSIPSVINMEVTIKKGGPKISFQAESHVKYTVTRVYLWKRETIAIVEKKSGTVNIKDRKAPYNSIIKYIITPEIVKENDTIIGESHTKLVYNNFQHNSSRKFEDAEDNEESEEEYDYIV